jgi:hypothetical protein
MAANTFCQQNPTGAITTIIPGAFTPIRDMEALSTTEAMPTKR